MTDKIHVCIISLGLPQEAGGAELRAFRHTRYLRLKNDTTAILICLDQENNSSDYALPNYVYPTRIFFQDFRSKSRILQMLKLCLYICEVILTLGWKLFKLRCEYDVLQILFAASWFTLIPIPIAKALGKTVILEMTDMGTDDPLTLNRRAAYPEKQMFPHRPLKYQLFLKADAYVSKSHPLSEAYRQAGLPDYKLFQIASAVDINQFRPPETLQEKIDVRIKLDLDPADKIILTVGRITEQKGLHWLLPALKEVLNHASDVKLLVAGPIMLGHQNYAQKRKREVEAWGLGENVCFLGRVSNVDEYLRAADIFVLPTAHEGFSGAILEAMASALPIVTSDIPEVSQSQINPGKEGILVPVGDISQLSQSIEKLLNNPKFAESLGRAARQRVKQEFTFDIIGSKYINLYKHLMSESKNFENDVIRQQ